MLLTTAEDPRHRRPFYPDEPVARYRAGPPVSTITRPSCSCNRIASSSAGKVNRNTSALLGMSLSLSLSLRSFILSAFFHSFFFCYCCRRPTSEYIESRDEYLYDEEIDFRLRLDSAVELLETDSFSESSPCSSADHSPNLADKGRLNLVTGAACGPCDGVQAFHMLGSEDNDNVSDESGYSDDKDVISSSSSASDASTVKASKGGGYAMAEEFTLNL